MEQYFGQAGHKVNGLLSESGRSSDSYGGLLVANRTKAMLAIWLLSGEKRTCRVQLISVANDPSATSGHVTDRPTATAAFVANMRAEIADTRSPIPQ